MKSATVGLKLATERKAAGLTQRALAHRMGTTQSAISRIESGEVVPTLPMIERYALAVDRPITIVVGERTVEASRVDLRNRVARVLGGYVFNPWDRDPTDSEARSLVADGLTRESFERRKPAASRRVRA